MQKPQIKNDPVRGTPTVFTATPHSLDPEKIQILDVCFPTQMGCAENASTFLYENGINCEHVWPQSLYEGGEPTKSDMHILRPCKDNVNSARANKPFNEINDDQVNTWYWLDSQTSNMPSSNINEYSENHGSYFEPREDRKGDIARTIFYFYSMYTDIADDNFFHIQKDVLKIWHELDPADMNEVYRTWQIAEYQQNKPNPLF